jgi:hypothetical protein
MTSDELLNACLAKRRDYLEQKRQALAMDILHRQILMDDLELELARLPKLSAPVVDGVESGGASNIIQFPRHV